MFKNLKVSWKLGLGFCTVVCITIALGGYGWNAFRQIGKATDLVHEATGGVEQMLALRGHEKDFVIRGFDALEGEKKNSVDKWTEANQSLVADLDLLRGTPGVTPSQTEFLEAASANIGEYATAFQEI